MEQPLENDLCILTRDFLWLNDSFLKFKTLFGSNHQRIDLMNQASPTFFKAVQDAMIANIVLGIFRIAGPETTGRGSAEKRNLVLATLVNEDIHGQWDGQDELRESLSDIADMLEPLKELRNKAIAHRDAEVARDASLLMTPKLSEIESAVQAIGDAIQFCQGRLRNTTLDLRLLGPIEDELFLLDTIRIGLEARKQQEAELLERIRSGDYRTESALFSTPDWLTN